MPSGQLRTKVDAGTSMPPPPRIRAIRSKTYAQVETGLLMRRRALLLAVHTARSELEKLSTAKMPPLLTNTRRNEALALEVPLDEVVVQPPALREVHHRRLHATAYDAPPHIVRDPGVLVMPHVLRRRLGTTLSA